MNPHQSVREAYNRIATEYLSARMANHPDIALLDELVDRLPRGAKVLDVGCGAGIPVTRFLSWHFDVLGVDISDEQINIARVSVPSAKFVRQDVTRLGLDDASFDAITCFYTIFHVPREEHSAVFGDFFRLLKSGGLLLICLYNGENEIEGEETFFRVPMYFSSFGVAESLALIVESGFELIWQKEIADPLDRDSSHVFVLVLKPGADRE